jgi:DNA-binding FadR family transcriptional regulator
MQELLKPIRTESLKDICVARFEELILSGRLSIGQKLPSERELALQLGVSRPVVHEGLIDLAAKGLVTLIPRKGTIVNDYRREGSIALLTSLLKYNQGKLEPLLLESILRMRELFEVETARLAALNREEDHLRAFEQLLEKEGTVKDHQVDKITELDFEFHLTVALASGNMIYPLLLNSFKPFYTNLAGQFFEDRRVIPTVFTFHRAFVESVRSQNADQAEEIMKQILVHGEKHLKKLIRLEEGRVA